MRKITLSIAVVVALAAAYELGRFEPHSQAHSKTSRRVAYYVDPMHPSYKSDKPGTAPDCGMALVPVYAEAEAPAAAGPVATKTGPGLVQVDAATQQLLGIQISPVEERAITRSVPAVGRVAPEDARVYRLNAGVDGFIRETFHDSVGTLVKKDQILATYYSPDFLAVASGFLAAVERIPGATGNDGSRTMPFPGAVSKQGVSSLQGYTDRLRNLGMSEVQIKRVADSKQLPEMIDVVAPVDGFILAKNISPSQHFEHTMEFYRIADLSRVWVLAEVSLQDAAYFRPGGAATVILRNAGRRIPAQISDSLPESEAGGGTVKVRLEADNPGLQLRPEMIVDVELPVRVPPAITVPIDAVIESGSQTRVYVEREQGVFEPREVETGWRFGERIQIVRGIRPGERVVTSATFLIDSESRLKPASPGTPRTGPPIGKAAQMMSREGNAGNGHPGHGDD